MPRRRGKTLALGWRGGRRDPAACSGDQGLAAELGEAGVVRIVDLTPARGAFYAEAAAVGLDNREHSSPTHMDVIEQKGKAQTTSTINIIWDPLPARATGNWDLVDATEHGACGIAALIVCKPRGLAMERARTGSGIDYWLAPGPLMQRSARLEVSGILRGPERIGERAKQKLKQTQKSAGELPVTVVVVEFSRPESWIADHER